MIQIIGMRPKITSTILADDTLGNDGRIHKAGSLHYRIEWINFILDANGAEVEHSVEFSEEVVLPPGSVGDDPTSVNSSYVSRVMVQRGDVRPGTYWQDKNQNKHYLLFAEPGTLGVCGQSINMENT